MSKTPRTDAEFKLEAFFDGVGIIETVPVEFARQLETELADKDKQLAKALADADHWKSECSVLQRMVHESRAEIESKNRLIEQMREALHLADDLIDEYAADYEHRDNVDEIREEIKAALAAESGE